jgi:hypothetical protein
MGRGKKNNKKLKLKLFSILALIVVGIGVGTFVGLPDVSADNEKTVELPPLSFFGGNSDNENSGVFAKVKQTTYIVDQNSQILVTDQSTGIEGNPLFAFIDPSSGKTIGGGVVIPKIWIDYRSAYEPNITFTPSTLYLTVQNQLENGSWKTTETKSIQTFSFTYGPSANGSTAEVPLASFGFSGNDIYQDLPIGDYNSLMRMSVHGDLHFHYTDSPLIAMTIPIGANDLKSWYTAKITDDTTPASVDTDGDGLNDDVDQCPSQKETYNGYQDTDGCADAVPDNTPEDDTPVPEDEVPGAITAQECADAGRIWTNGICVDDPTDDGPGTSGGLGSRDVFAVVAVKTTYLDGSSTSRAFTSDSDGVFGFTLNSLIQELNGRTLSIGSLAYTVFIGSYTDALQGLKIDSSDLKFKGTVDIASKELNAGTKTGTGGSTSEAKTFTVPDLDTSVTFSGIELAKATFTSVDIHNAINSFDGIEIVPEGSQRDLAFIVDISGPVVMKSSSTGSSDTISGALVGASTTFDGLTLVNQVVPKTGAGYYDTFGEAETACGGSANVKSVDGKYTCIPGVLPEPKIICSDNEYVVVIENVETCIKKGGTIEEPTPVPGEPGVSICVDANNTGGFSCTIEYRGLWCNGTTTCEVPPSNDTPDCNDTKTCPTPEPEPQCTVPDGYQLNSIADNICVNISPDDDPKVTTGCFIPISQKTITSCLKDGYGIDLNDPLILGLVVLGGIIGAGAIFKRDSRFSPIPASTTQFSR